MSRRLLLQDACVLINLMASGRFEDIARGGGWQFVVATAVCAETHYMRDPATGESVPIDLALYFAAGLLEQVRVETEAERNAYIAYAAQRLDDGEAMSLALAQSRHLALATDDRRARLIIERENVSVELHSTVSVLQSWEAQCKVPAAEMRRVLERIRNGARFSPRSMTADHAWWTQRLQT